MGPMGTRKLISFEEFERLDFGTDKLELLQGEVIGLAPPDGIMDYMATTTLMSFAEFELLDFGADDVELLRGELIRLPPPQREHMQICRRLLKVLDAALERWKRNNPEARIGEVEVEMGYLVSSSPSSWLRPDVSLTHPDQPGDHYYEGAPLDRKSTRLNSSH